MANNNITATLYTSSAAPNKLYKGESITELATKSCYLKDANSISAPHIVLSYDTNGLTANYVYIAEFNRYYFVKDRIVEPGKKIELILAVDVLYSFWGHIRNKEIIVERVGDRNYEDSYIQDSLNVPKQYTESFILEFPWDFNDSASGAPIYVLAK